MRGLAFGLYIFVCSAAGCVRVRVISTGGQAGRQRMGNGKGAVSEEEETGGNWDN